MSRPRLQAAVPKRVERQEPLQAGEQGLEQALEPERQRRRARREGACST
jgi:hypothetical protein